MYRVESLPSLFGQVSETARRRLIDLFVSPFHSPHGVHFISVTCMYNHSCCKALFALAVVLISCCVLPILQYTQARQRHGDAIGSGTPCEQLVSDFIVQHDSVSMSRDAGASPSASIRLPVG